MFERFSESAKDVAEWATEEAERFHHASIGTEHLLLAILRLRDSVAVQALEYLGITYGAVCEQVVAALEPSDIPTGTVRPNVDAMETIQHASIEADHLGAAVVEPEHILLAIVRSDNVPAAEILAALGQQREEIRAMVLKFINGYGAELQELNRPLGDTGITVGQAMNALGNALNPLATLLEVLGVPNLDRHEAKEHAQQLLALFDFLAATGALTQLDEGLVEAMELFIQEFVDEAKPAAA